MKYFTATLLSSTVAAQGLLPSVLQDLSNLGQSALAELNTTPHPADSFDAASQLVDVTGSHAWKAPSSTDARGPCPGLNALANHGYLPRNGYASILQLTAATNEVYNMGLDLGTILSVYGAALDGALISWSIGGEEHTGIGGSRGNYESDSSPTRGDLNQYGSNVDLVLSQFKELYHMQPNAATANYDLDVLGEFRASRYNESVMGNPYFYYPPFAGTDVTQAAFVFIYRFMANHTEANPEGVLDQETLKSFFGVSGSDSNLTWNRGYERIPDNWYRRPANSPYTLTYLADDITDLGNKYPFIGVPGCNMGKVNTFTKLSQTNTSAANYDFTDPIQGVCYGMAQALNVAGNVPVVGDVVQELLLPLQNGLSCPLVVSSNGTESIGKGCPGYANYGGPTGPVAPGAIQY